MSFEEPGQNYGDSTESGIVDQLRYGHPERDPDAKTLFELDAVSKAYDDTTVIDDLSLEIREGELLTLLGPSGCGKTTTLRLIAGLETPSQGRLVQDGTVVAHSEMSIPADQRDVGVVFQDFALFPHLTAAENVGFGIEDHENRSERVRSLLELVGLSGLEDARPETLSGGQRQRVALARSLAPAPELLLLDEPFSNLDVDLRVEMREEVRRILKETGVTAVSVTHDQEEAMSISDRVAVMNAGQLEQIGRPEQVFQQPESRFVASFLGHASFLSGTVSGDIVTTGLGEVPLGRIHGLSAEYDGSRVDLMIRPDDVRGARPAEHAANGTVVHRRYLGPTVLYRVELESGDMLGLMHNHAEEIALDAPISVQLTADHDLAWFPRGRRQMADGGHSRAPSARTESENGTE